MVIMAYPSGYARNHHTVVANSKNENKETEKNTFFSSCIGGV